MSACGVRVRELRTSKSLGRKEVGGMIGVSDS